MADLPDFTAERGPAVTPAQIADFVGLGHRFVLEDIRQKELAATDIGHGDRIVYRIAFSEAKRYVKKLGAI